MATKESNSTKGEGRTYLVALAEDLEESVDDHNGEDDDLDELEDDSEDGEQDKHEGMSDDEITVRRNWRNMFSPVRLSKASPFKLDFDSFAHIAAQDRIFNYIRTQPELNHYHPFRMVFDVSGSLDARMMPKDVSTCWNSTFDMVDFTIDYQPVIGAITGNRDMKMQSFELDASKWVIAKEPDGMCSNFLPLIKILFNLSLRYSSTAPFSFQAIPQISAPSFP